MLMGMERGEFAEAADVYVVNTCTITDRADAESLRLARRARRLNPHARVIMTGCLAQANPDALAKAREVDAVVGLDCLGDLEQAVAGLASERVMVSDLRKESATIELGAVALEGHTRAFLKLQEGCDQFLHLLYRAVLSWKVAQRWTAAGDRDDRRVGGAGFQGSDPVGRTPGGIW